MAMNFAATVDGRATIGGVSGPIGSDADTAMLVGLRTRFDAVMIGAGTMRAERYGGAPTKRAAIVGSETRMVTRGRTAWVRPSPPAVLLTASTCAAERAIDGALHLRGRAPSRSRGRPAARPQAAWSTSSS